MTKITISDVNKKNLKIVAYLIGSGILGYLSATYVVGNPMLTIIFAPAINFVAYSLVNELSKEGYTEAIKNK
jgi:hypothetical protein